MTHLISPNACQHCGVDEPEHLQRWKPPVGWHKWAPPTQTQIKARMFTRRNARLTAAPIVYHATTAWAADSTGEEGIPFCATCKTDGCRPWMRIQDRLARQRWGLPRPARRTFGGWGEAPW